MSKRAGELSEEEVERIITIISNPRQYKIPDYFLNRQKDIKDGKHCLAYNSWGFYQCVLKEECGVYLINLINFITLLLRSKC